MKTKWVVAATLLFVATMAIDASAHGRGRGGKGYQQASLSELLGLTEEQQADLQALKTGIMEQKQALYEEYQAGFTAVLTADQLIALDELKANRRKHHCIVLVEALGLSEDQVAQLQALGEQKKAHSMALHEAYQADFSAILTADQLAAYAELKANRMGRHGDKHRADATEPADADGTTEATLQAPPTTNSIATAVKETSWGRIKGTFGE